MSSAESVKVDWKLTLMFLRAYISSVFRHADDITRNDFMLTTWTENRSDVRSRTVRAYAYESTFTMPSIKWSSGGGTRSSSSTESSPGIEVGDEHNLRTSSPMPGLLGLLERQLLYCGQLQEFWVVMELPRARDSCCMTLDAANDVGHLAVACQSERDTTEVQS